MQPATLRLLDYVPATPDALVAMPEAILGLPAVAETLAELPNVEGKTVFRYNHLPRPRQATQNKVIGILPPKVAEG